MDPTCEAKREHSGNKHNTYPKVLFHKWVPNMSCGMVSNMKIPQAGPERVLLNGTEMENPQVGPEHVL